MLEDLPVPLGEQLLLPLHLGAELVGQPDAGVGPRLGGDLDDWEPVNVVEAGVVAAAQLVEEVAVGPVEGVVVRLFRRVGRGRQDCGRQLDG